MLVEEIEDNVKVNGVEDEVEFVIVDMIGDIVKLFMKEFVDVVGVDKLRLMLLKLNLSELFLFWTRDKFVDIGGFIILGVDLDDLLFLVFCIKLLVEYIDLGLIVFEFFLLDFIMELELVDILDVCCKLLEFVFKFRELFKCLDWELNRDLVE